MKREADAEVTTKRNLSPTESWFLLKLRDVEKRHYPASYWPD